MHRLEWHGEEKIMTTEDVCCCGVPVEAFRSSGSGTNDNAMFTAAALTCNEQVLELQAGVTYKLNNWTIPAGSGCSGVVGCGGQPIVTVGPGAIGSTNAIILSRTSDFVVDGIFFDLPISTNPSSAPLASSGFRTDTGGKTRLRITNNRFRGGNVALYLTEGIDDTYVVNNLFEETWGDAIDCVVGKNVFIADNIIQDGGYSSTTVSGAIRIGASYILFTSENVFIARNVIRNYAVNSHQNVIDCFSTGVRNLSIVENICDLCGSGIELKTDNSTPADAVYKTIVVANNIIRCATAGATSVIGIAVNLSAPNTPDTKAGDLLIEGNLIVADTPASPSDSFYGIAGAAYYGVIVQNNRILDFARGINFDPIYTEGNNLKGLSIIDNEIRVSSVGIINVATGTAICDMTIKGNRISAGEIPCQFANTPLSNLLIEDNIFIATGSTSGLDLRDVVTGLVKNNTIKGGPNSYGVTVQGTGTASLEFLNNYVSTDTSSGLDAFSISTGNTVTLTNNDVRVLPARRGVSGTGSYTARTNRGFASANPSSTTAGSVGDTFQNSAPVAGADKWICTVAGNAGSATYTQW